MHQINQALPFNHRVEIKRPIPRLVPKPQQLAGCRVGGTHDAAPIDHQNAFGQRFNHQLVDPSLHPRGQLAALRPQLNINQTGRNLAGQKRNDKTACTRQRRLQKMGGHVPRCLNGHPAGIAKQQQGHARRRAHGHQQRAQNGGHQNRQGEQGRVVDAVALHPLQGGKSQQINANGADPLDVKRLSQLARMRQQAHRQRSGEIAGTNQEQGAVFGGSQHIDAALKQYQHHTQCDAGGHEAAPKPLKFFGPVDLFYAGFKQ